MDRNVDRLEDFEGHHVVICTRKNRELKRKAFCHSVIKYGRGPTFILSDGEISFPPPDKMIWCRNGVDFVYEADEQRLRQPVRRQKQAYHNVIYEDRIIEIRLGV